MELICNHLYHIYNQGNNKEIIFKDRDDYIKFLKKAKTMISPYCDIISYCLMPNHFHFLLDVNDISCEKIVLGNIELTKLSNGFRSWQSEYAREFNQKYYRSGSLFRQRTKSKCLTESKDVYYSRTCFHYIHQNPMTATLVDKMED